jgi:hypothetical protein
VTVPQQYGRKTIVADFLELTSVPGVVPDIISALREEAYSGGGVIRRVEATRPKIGRDLQRHAVHATVTALGGMLLWAAFRLGFDGTVAAVFRDVVTAGFFSPFDREILSFALVAGVLVLLYSRVLVAVPASVVVAECGERGSAGDGKRPAKTGRRGSDTAGGDPHQGRRRERGLYYV